MAADRMAFIGRRRLITMFASELASNHLLLPLAAGNGRHFDDFEQIRFEGGFELEIKRGKHP